MSGTTMTRKLPRDNMSREEIEALAKEMLLEILIAEGLETPGEEIHETLN